MTLLMKEPNLERGIDLPLPLETLFEPYHRVIQQVTKEYDVPYDYLYHLLYQAQDVRYGNRWLAGYEDMAIFLKDWTVRLGLGQVEVKRVAHLIHPHRDWLTYPLTEGEFEALVNQLETPTSNIHWLTQTLRANYNALTSDPSQCDLDRWRLAIARHKLGERAMDMLRLKLQAKRLSAGCWAEVVLYLDEGVREAVEQLAG